MNTIYGFLFALLLLTQMSLAETPVAPRADIIVVSEDHKYLCHVAPMDSRLGATNFLNPTSSISFYHFSADSDGYLRFWDRELPSSMHPLRTRVSSDGQFVAVIGDYNAIPGQILVYRAVGKTSEDCGKLLLSTSFNDILTPAELALIPAPGDQRYWVGPHRIDIATKTLNLQIYSGGTIQQPQYREIILDLYTGKRLK